MKQRTGKDDDEDEPGEHEESCGTSSTAVSHAVSVIRAVPVITKVKRRDDLLFITTYTFFN